MAQGLLEHRVAELGLDVRVVSAGLLSSGNPASPPGVEVLRGRGVDLSRHLSRSMTRELLLGADLILGMAREHVREAVLAAPEVWPRTFTLKELVRRGERVGPRRAAESVEEWLARVHAGRRQADLSGWSRDDDVADPIGRPRAVYLRLAEELDDLLARAVALLWPDARRTPPDGRSSSSAVGSPS